jgi:hypothetical protein
LQRQVSDIPVTDAAIAAAISQFNFDLRIRSEYANKRGRIESVQIQLLFSVVRNI